MKKADVSLLVYWRCNGSGRIGTGTWDYRIEPSDYTTWSRRGATEGTTGGAKSSAESRCWTSTGRKKQPEILKALDELLKDETAGDPITGLKWTKKTSYTISRELQRQGYEVGADTVRRLLKISRFVLRANRKRVDKRKDPNRDRQMRYLVRKRKRHEKAGFPSISVDAKQRERIGNFKNPGCTYRRKALDVLESDYPSDADGVAIPYGVYDTTHNEGFVVIGVSHQTPEFAVACIRRWWLRIGKSKFPRKQHLLIQADCGGANGNRLWTWKYALQKLADECRLTISVTHLPTSASKWNPIEHKLFCHIEANWAGVPLVNYETIIKCIRTTKTETGLQCRAYLDRKQYGTGNHISSTQKTFINLKPHRVYRIGITPSSRTSRFTKPKSNFSVMTKGNEAVTDLTQRNYDWFAVMPYIQCPYQPDFGHKL